MLNLQNIRITVTGGNGFLGKVVVKKLCEAGFINTFVLDSKQHNFIAGENHCIGKRGVPEWR